jgi:ribonuclease Z
VPEDLPLQAAKALTIPHKPNKGDTMKRAILALSLALNLIAFSVVCSLPPENDYGDTAEAGVPEAGSPTPEAGLPDSGPPPKLPQGPLWSLLETQMATVRATGDLVRGSLLNKDMITVMICGSNNPLPLTPGAQSCATVFVNGQFLLFDSGDGAQRSMERLNLPMADLTAVFYTHYHNDHMADLGEVIQRSWTLGRRHHLPIYGGKGLTKILKGFKDAYEIDKNVRSKHHGGTFLPTKYMDAKINPISVAEGKSAVVYQKDGVVVTAFDVNHPPVEPALGFTVTYKGRKVVISGDTTDTPTLRQQSVGADVLVSDVMNMEVVKGMEAISVKRGWTYNATIFRDIREYHMGVDDLAALAKAGGVKTLVLTHMIPNVTQESLMKMWFTDPIKKQYQGKLLLAHDGTMVKVRDSTPAGRKLVTETYASGAVRSEVPYLNEVKDGVALYWYESGQVQAEIKWTNGSGRALYYAKTGALIPPSVHPDYSGKLHSLPKAKALIVTTSVGTMGPGGAKTGVFASEMTAPYYEFLGAGMDVDVASIKGGAIPVDPLSFLPGIISKYDQRYLRDKVLLAKTTFSQKIDNLDFTKYDVVYLAGGWGAAYDLGYSDVLGNKLTEAYKAGVLLGAVCHGSLGLLKAKDTSGNPLVKGRRITGVTDKQVKELGIQKTPQHPETELKKAGAIFESITGSQDFLENYVVADGTIVTGQNQNAGAEVAHRLMELIAKKP